MSKGFHTVLLIFIMSLGLVSTARGDRLGAIRKKLRQTIAGSPRQQVFEILGDLERLKIKGEIPKDVISDLEGALKGSSHLFDANAENRSRGVVQRNSRYYDEEVLFRKHRSAIKLLSNTLYARVYRAFFFSRFDFSPEQIRGLFLGLIAETPWKAVWENHFNGSSSSAFYVLDRIWRDFEGVVEKAAEEGRLEGLGIVDFEAAFISVPSDFFIHEITKKNPLDRAFTTLTDRFVKNSRLVDLYRSPHLRLSRPNPYRDEILFGLTKEDLSDKDLLLKWWKDVSPKAGHETLEKGLGGNVDEVNKGYLRLKSFVQSAVDDAKEAGEGFEEAFDNDPFILTMYDAINESENFGKVIDEISSEIL